MRRLIVAGLSLCLASAASSADAPNDRQLASILFWTPAEQLAGYKAIEKSYPTRGIAHGMQVYPLPTARKPLNVAFHFRHAKWNTAKYMASNHISGLLVIKDGKVVVERYALGRTAKDRWVSFSVTKSVTSTLVGAAIRDGYIKSLDAMVTDYLPALKGSAYEGVSIRNLLTMSSGVKWNEDYGDANSDVAKFAVGKPGPDGENPIVTYMAKLPREAAPGTKFVYKTGESDLIGILLERAIGQHPSDYLSTKIWTKFGMGSDANWMLDQSGSEVGGCCISMTLRDYGRLGLFIMGGGVAGGEHVVPPDYLAEATKQQISTGWGSVGYGYQWWIYPHGSFAAIGVFGQTIYIDPAEKLIVVTNSAWPEADADRYYEVTTAYVQAVTAALHGT